MKNPFRKYNLEITYGWEDVTAVSQALTELEYEVLDKEIIDKYSRRVTVAPSAPWKRINIHEMQDWFEEKGLNDRVNVSWS